jgi:hypothetical protein
MDETFTPAKSGPGSHFKSAYSPIPLAGAQEGVYESREYIVDDSMVVPAGDTLTFDGGTTVRFAQYAGLRVYGTLIGRGGQGGPIVFTGAADTVGGEPEPFDWNGISVKQHGHILLRKSRILYSTFGIQADSGCVVSLDSVMFNKNGTSNLSHGRNVSIDEGKPVCWPEPCAAVSSSDGGPLNPENENPALKSTVKRKRNCKIPVIIGSGACAVGAGALAFYYDNRLELYAGRANPATSLDVFNSNYTKAERYETYRNASLIACGVTAAVCVVILVIDLAVK